MFPIPSMLGQYGDAAPPESAADKLSGTLGSPNIKFHVSAGGGGNAIVSFVIAATDAGATITRAFVEKAGYNSGDLAVYAPIEQWVSPEDFQEDYWVRLTAAADDAPSGGSSTGTWHLLQNGSSNHFFYWEATGPIGTEAGTVKVEIATDALGASIVATGYYRGVANNEP